MELIINKFAELSNRNFSTPIAIVGDNGVGKTSTMNAYLWALTGKGKDGSEMNEAVYSVNDSIVERRADVEVVLNGTHFHKVCCSVLQRKRGSDEMVLKSACSNTFYINDVEVTKAVYEAEVNKLCQGKPFGLFTDIQYFSRLPKDKQTEIFVEMLNINKDKFFGNLRDYQEIRADLKAVVNTIERNATLIEGFSSELQKTAIPTDFSSKIAEIKTEIDDLVRQRPRLTADQIADNNRIIAEIAKLEAQPLNFTISNAKRDNLNEKKVYFQHLYTEWQSAINDKACTEAALRKAKEDMAKWGDECEFSENTPEFNDLRAKIDTFSAKKEKDATLLENYAENLKNASCGLCPHCDNIFCENKVADLPSEADLVRNITEFDNKIADLRAKMSQMRDDWQKNKEDEHKEIAERISRFEEKLAKIDVEGAKKAVDDAEKAMEIAKIEYAKEIDANTKAREDRDRQIAEDNLIIADLRAQMHTAEASSTDDKIADLKVKLADFEAKQKVYNEVSGHRKGLADSIEKLSQTNSDLTIKRIAYEKEVIAWESADKRYRDVLTEKANEMLPEGMKLSLFRPLITGDGYVSEFAITYDSKRYKNTALQIWGDFQLTKVLQKGFGVHLPIFIDDVANIVDDRLLPKGEDVILIVAVKDLPLYYQKPDGII